MDPETKVVFICPSYNIEPNVQNLLSSLRIQTDDRWHCFIIDDMSSDETFKTLSQQSLNDNRFTIIKNTEKKYALRNTIECVRSLTEEVIVAVVDGH